MDNAKAEVEMSCIKQNRQNEIEEPWSKKASSYTSIFLCNRNADVD